MNTLFQNVIQTALLAFGLLLLAGSAGVQAATVVKDNELTIQSTQAEESTTNEVRWYQVELLIFKQRSVSTEIAELWPKDITLSYPDNWDTLKTPDEYQAMYQKKSVVNTPYILLDKKQFQFAGIEKKLQINRNEILFHGAWRQSLTQNLDQAAETKVTPLLIHGGDRYDDHYELEGTVTLSLLRYLHFDTSLWLTRFVHASANAVAAPTVVTVDPAINPATPIPVASWPELPTYPLLKATGISDVTTTDAAPVPKKYQVDEIVLNKQSRRMRSYETHYIDHPKFGILIRMTPLDTNTMLPIPPKN